MLAAFYITPQKARLCSQTCKRSALKKCGAEDKEKGSEKRFSEPKWSR